MVGGWVRERAGGRGNLPTSGDSLSVFACEIAIHMLLLVFSDH